MHEAPEFEPVTLPAKRFAHAWTACFHAAGGDKDDFLTYRTVGLEVFPDLGVRLVCTNRGLLIRAWVPCLHLVDEDGDTFYDEPAIDVAPETVVVVRDLAKRGGALMSYLRTATPLDKDDEDAADGWALTLAPGRIKPDAPNLGSLFDEWGVVFTSPRSQECLPALESAEMVPQQWRHLDAVFSTAAPVAEIKFSSENLAAVAKVPSPAGVAWHFEQPAGLPFVIARLAWFSTDVGLVQGMLAPISTAASTATTPEQDAEADVAPFTRADAETLAADDADPDDEAPSFMEELGVTDDDGHVPKRPRARRDLDD